MDLSVPVVAGVVSTGIFAFSTLPMLVKAAQTKDLESYSLGQILLANVGNVIHSVYVFHLPVGPVWVLHSYYLVTTALMLVWYVRYASRRSRRRGVQGYMEIPMSREQTGLRVSPDALHAAGSLTSRARVSATALGANDEQ